MMAEGSIPVDLFNPGQVFACMGLMETANILLGDAEGGFDWSDSADVQFKVQANGNRNPIESVLNFLTKAKVYSLAPPGSQLSTEKWKVDTKMLSYGDAFPFPVPGTPATLPAVLELESDAANKTMRIVISHWGENQKKTFVDNVKFWAGAGGYPGAALAKDALDLIRDMPSKYLQNPFELSMPQSSSFRFDWRRDYIDVNIGFSLNNHSKRFKPMGFPIVEILAAIGLTNARPKFIRKLKYCYGVASVLSDGGLLDICLMRATLGGSANLPFKQRIFYMDLGWPGKEGQARCITNVVEC